MLCKSLGYLGVKNFAKSSYFGDASSDFSYIQLKCSGTETSLRYLKLYREPGPDLLTIFRVATLTLILGNSN